MARTRSGHQPDYVLALVALGLLVFGLIMLSSASSVLGFQRFHDSYYFFKRQLVGVAAGLLLGYIAYRIDYQRWRAWAVPIMFATVVLLLAVFLPGIGSLFLGARRWIHLGPILFQPSELAKLAIIIYLASWFERRTHVLKDTAQGLAPFLFLLGIVVALIMAQPDLGTTTIIVLVGVGMYFLAGGPAKHLLWIATAGAGILFLLIKFEPYRVQRFTVFLNPDLDPQGIGYHINQARLAIGSGGLFGLGLGRSRQKFNYLPEPAGDSIIAVTAEEVGFLFLGVFLLAWLWFLWRAIDVAKRAPDVFGQLLAGGIIVWLGFQTFINVGAMAGILPLTGIPLPLMSHGSSAMVMNLIALGILLNISRHTSHQRT